jgi:DNA-binding transcriptional LysR family regulator
MKPNPVDMFVFLAVAEARSFTAAAANLGKTTSAVSQAVSRLEQDLDCRLFTRTTRAIALTEAGALAVSQCGEIHRAYQTAKTDLQSLETSPTGVLSVTAPHALSGSIVAPALTRFCRDNPELSVRLVADDAPINLVDRQIDLSLRVGNPTGQSARIAKIGSLTEALYAHPDYVTGKGGVPSALANLSTWDHIANEWQGSPVTYAGRGGPALRVVPRFRCNTASDVLTFCEAGAGVALLPVSTANQAVERGTLSPLFTIAKTPIFAMHQYDTRPPAKVSKFIAMLRADLR